MASIDTIGRPVISDRRLANVDLPDPDDPNTTTRCMVPIRSRAVNVQCALHVPP